MPTTTAPSYTPFSFLTDPPDSSRIRRGQAVRDGLAMIEVIGTVSKLGYVYGGQVFNHPGARVLAPNGPAAFETPVLHKVPLQAGRGDVILTVTRLVTHPDIEALDRCYSRCADTDLELVLAEHWARYFRRLTRTMVKLAPHLHAELKPGFEDRRDIVFYQVMRKASERANGAGAALYRQLSRKRYRGDARTAAFLLRHEEIWPGGPDYIGLFGMTSLASGAWARIVCQRMPDLLMAPGFVMAELRPGDAPEHNGSLEYADGWGAEVILHHVP